MGIDANYRIENGMLFFWGSVYSQWYTTPNQFSEDGVSYSSAEKYMMMKKAELMKDYGMHQKMLPLHDPRELKKLGREVKNWDESLWDVHKVDIVTRANFLKFYCNSDLLETMEEHKDLTIVEASPYDSVWGIGLGVEDDDVLDESKWKGSNLLGVSIMNARDMIFKLGE